MTIHNLTEGQVITFGMGSTEYECTGVANESVIGIYAKIYDPAGQGPGSAPPAGLDPFGTPDGNGDWDETLEVRTGPNADSANAANLLAVWYQYPNTSNYDLHTRNFKGVQ